MPNPSQPTQSPTPMRPDRSPEARRFAPATHRNRAPILSVLARVLPEKGLVLEIASGTGEHACAFAQSFPRLRWQPSDVDAQLRESIAAHAADAGCANLLPPLALDAAADVWPLERADAIVCINLLHIAPWSVAQGVVAGAERLLPPGGVLYLYGPYKRGGDHTAPSNAAFDASLRAQNSAWGVRDLEAVQALAEAAGLRLQEIVEMPANNLSLVFIRAGAGDRA